MASLKSTELHISHHEVRVYRVTCQNQGWLTAKDIAGMSDVSARTARHHAARLTKLGVFDVARVFGGYRYRIKTELEPSASKYVGQIEAAGRILT